MLNPIDKDKTAEFPGLIPYPHNIGSIVVKPEDVGKIKSRALSAMKEQTEKQLLQIHKQLSLLAEQANEIKHRYEISEKIYTCKMSFEPFIGHTYHLYKNEIENEIENEYQMMMIAPNEWGRTKTPNLKFIKSVKLLSDYTWEVI